MTLIITYASRGQIYQCGDFRLTAPNGTLVDYWAQKQIFVQRFSWTAVVGFCGAAETGRQYVPEWIVERLRGIGQRAGFETLIDALKTAENWLPRWDAKYRALTFSVGAFVDFEPVFVLVSNFEALDRRVPNPRRRRGAPPRFFPSRLHVSRYRPRRPRLFLSGRPESVLPQERLRLLGLLRKDPPSEKVFAVLADINAHAATRDHTVGRACFTSYLNRLGDGAGMVHDWPADRDYLPAFVDVHGLFLPRLQRGVDDSGQPKALQLRSTTASAYNPSAKYFRLTLEEKPSDPVTLSNYGNWLKERGQPAEAERAYRQAIAADPSFANAHGNLAILLEEEGDLDAAEQEYRQASALDDNSPLHLVNLAYFLWLKRGETKEAQALVEQAASLQRDPFTLGRQAWFTESALGERAAAAKLYEAALQMAPEDEWVNGRYASLLLSQDDVEEARKHFEIAGAGDKPDLVWLIGYALLEVRGHHFEAAERLLKRAVRKYPRSADALVNFAAVRSRTGSDDAAIEQMYRRALQLCPGQTTASLNLAALLLRQGDADEAAALLAAVAGHPDLTEEERMELLFYGFAHQVPGYERCDTEIASMAANGIRVVDLGFSRDVEAAERNGHAMAYRVGELAGMMTAS